MKRAVGLLALIGLAIVSLVVLRNGAPEPGGVESPVVDPGVTSAGAEADAARLPADEVRLIVAEPTRRTVEPAVADRPGAKLFGSLRLGDEPLADAAIEVWREDRDEEPERVAELRSDAEGRFAIDGLEAQRHVIAVVDERVPIGTVVADLTPQQDDEVGLGELVIAPPERITLRVIDEAGMPVADARVVLRHDAWSMGFGPQLRLGLVGGAPGKWPERRTDADGELRWERIATGRATLVIDTDGFAPRSYGGEVVAGGGLALGDVRLKRGRRIDGRVVDWQGHPVAGASVKVRDGLALGAHAERVATSGDDGSFTITGVEDRGVKPLLVEADAQVPTVFRDYAQGGIAELRLPRGFWVHGSVVGAPRDAIRIRVGDRDNRKLPFESRYHLTSREHELDADGHFRIGPFLPAEWEIWAEAGARGASPRQVVTIREADIELELEIPESTGLPVLVRDADGAPVAGVKVAWTDEIRFPEAYRQAGRRLPPGLLMSSERSGKQTVTDERGLAQLPIDCERPFGIAVAPEGGIALSQAFVDGERPERVEFTLIAVGGIRGRLLDVPTTAIESWSVIARPQGGGAQARESSGKCRADGGFEIGALEAGRYDLSVYARVRRFDADAPVRAGAQSGVLGEWFPVLVEGVEVRPGQLTTCDVALPSPGRIRGVVRSRGEPVEGCQVFAWVPDDDGQSRQRVYGGGKLRIDDDRPPFLAQVAISGPDGTYRFDVLQPGRWQVFVRHPRGFVTSGPWPVEITAAGQDVVLDLRLGGSRIDVQVDPAWLSSWPDRSPEAFLFRAEDAGEDPVGIVFDQLPETAFHTPAPIDADGRARFDFVPAGRYVLRFVALMRRVIHQQGLTVGIDEQLTIGPIAKPVSVTIDVPVQLPELSDTTDGRRVCLVLRARFDGIDTGAFARRAEVKDGRLRVEDLPVGRYEVACDVVVPGVMAVTFHPMDQHTELTVHEDGSTTPPELDLR